MPPSSSVTFKGGPGQPARPTRIAATPGKQQQAVQGPSSPNSAGTSALPAPAMASHLAAAATGPTSGLSTSSPATVANTMANTRAIMGTFEKYQKERLQFAQTVAEYAGREGNIDALCQAGVMALLRPLLSDPVPAVQQAAAVALGRLANYNEAIAGAVVNSDILPHLIRSLKEQNRFYKKSAAFVLRSIARHSPALARQVVDAGALLCLVNCLEEFDPAVKESAASAVGFIARHDADLAQAVVDAGVVPLLGLCVQEPEMALKRIAASSLCDIASHTPALAMTVVDAQILPHLCSHLHISTGTSSSSSVSGGAAGFHADPKLVRQVVRCLSAVAKHNTELAEYVIDGDIFPGTWLCFKSADAQLKKASAELVCNIVKHSSELSQLIVHSGGSAVLVDYVCTIGAGAGPLSVVPGIAALGYVASLNDTLAMSIVASKGVDALAALLDAPAQEDETVRSMACWALGQIGKHSAEHAKHLTDASILISLLRTMKRVENVQNESDAELHAKSKKALKTILANTLDAKALDPLLQTTTPPNILKYVLAQLALILPKDVAARREFVVSGGLSRVEEIAALYAIGPVSSISKPSVPPSQVNTADPKVYTAAKLSEHIRTINDSFPEEIVRYYSPGYASTLLTKIDEAAVAATATTSEAKPSAASAMSKSGGSRTALVAAASIAGSAAGNGRSDDIPAESSA